MNQLKLFSTSVLIAIFVFPFVLVQNLEADGKSLAGKWARYRQFDQVLQTDLPYYITMSGNQFEAHLVQKAMGFPDFQGTINGSNIEGIALVDWSDWPKNGGRLWKQPMTGTLSADGNTLTFRYDDVDRKYYDGNISKFAGWETFAQEWVLRRIG
jgi:hypothetical protein